MNDQPVRRRQRHLAMLALRTMAPKAGCMGCWAGMSSPNASRGGGTLVEVHTHLEGAVSMPADNERYGLEGSHSPVARLARGGEASTPLGQHSAQRRAKLRLRGRAGRSGDAGGRARAAADASCFRATRCGAPNWQALTLQAAPAATICARGLVVGRTERRPAGDQPDAKPFGRQGGDQIYVPRSDRRMAAGQWRSTSSIHPIPVIACA